MLHTHFHFAFFKSWLFMSVTVAVVVYAGYSSETTAVAPPVRTSSTVLADESPSTVFSGTLSSYLYLPPVQNAYPGSSLYWGALVDGQAPSTANMGQGGVFDTFETRARKKMSILHWGQPWKMNGSYQSFYAAWFDNVRDHGSIPLVDWGSWQLGAGSDQIDFKLSAI